MYRERERFTYVGASARGPPSASPAQGSPPLNDDNDNASDNNNANHNTNINFKTDITARGSPP